MKIEHSESCSYTYLWLLVIQCYSKLNAKQSALPVFITHLAKKEHLHNPYLIQRSFTELFYGKSKQNVSLHCMVKVLPRGQTISGAYKCVSHN